MRKIHLAVAAVLIGASFALAGCGLGNHTSDNTSKVAQPTGPATVIQFPYGFRNVAAKCDGTTMVYSGSAGVDDYLPPSIAAVPNDPRCK